MLKVRVGVNDLASLYPEVANEWHPTKNTLSPSEVVAGAARVVWWQCSSGHEWEAPVYSRTKRLSQCPYCANKRVWQGFNDLATTHPALVNEWHPLKNGDLLPTNVIAGSDKKVWWQCAQGHEWQAKITNRVRGAKCHYCVGHKLLPGFNDLATLHPELAKEWHPTKNVRTASDVHLHANTKAWWLCSSNASHVWEALINNRANGQGCPYCSGRSNLTGHTDLATLYPLIATEWHPTKNGLLTADQTLPQSNQVVWWQCAQGHEWQTPVYVRTRGSECAKCSGNGTSTPELQIGDWLESLNLRVVRNTRQVIKPYELDIYLPDHNFAVEYNGLYWHSEAAGKGKDYHLKKVKAAQAAGVYLFQVWEDDWRDREIIIKRMILHRLGLSNEPVVFARKTEVVELTTAQAHSFLAKNHLQGKANGGLYLGLISGDTLVACMVMKRMSGGVVYLERYATSMRVPGGFTRLLKHAVRLLKPVKIVTFADQSISEGNLYEKNGFIAERVLSPDYSYLVNNRRVHKFNYRLKRFRDDPELKYVEGMSESQLAVLNKLPRIWDSGKTRYVLSP